jgi:hypothetical protein
MILILEGYSNSTRDALIEQFMQRNYELVINSLPMTLTELLEQAKTLKDNTVLVNYYITQQLQYSNTNPKAIITHRMVERILLSKKVVIGVSYSGDTKKDKILSALVSKSALPKFEFSDSIAGTIKDLVNTISGLQTLENFGSGIGSFKSDSVLLIGESVGNVHKSESKGEYPFASLYGTGFWLSELFEHYNFNENDFYWINAFQINGDKTDSSFINTLKPRLVIALGNKAHQWCIDNNILNTKVPHPSYWKRFNSALVHEYPLLQHIKHSYK